MKILLSILILLLMELNADEIQRIELMVKEISKLRDAYVKTGTDLATCKHKAKENTLMESDYKKREEKYINRINYLENQLKLSKKIVIIKEKIKNNSQTKNKICLDNQILEDNNPFPKLKMKKEFSNSDKKIEYFTPSSFRVKNSADIYDGVDANIIETWEDRRSFTSNTKQGRWIKITGYFINQQWRPSQNEMWVKSCDVFNRDKVSK